jgi:hypothetical protein
MSVSPRNEIQELEHAAVIAMLAEAVAVLLFIAAVAVWAALGAGA